MVTFRRVLSAVAACLLVAGCATTYEKEVHVEEPVLPSPMAPPFAAKVGVYFSEDFRHAAPQSSKSFNDFVGNTYTFRHVIGAAGVAMFRQALEGSFDGVVELQQWPAPPAAVRGLAAIVVPSVPKVSSAQAYQSVEYAVELHAPTGEPLARWDVHGIAMLGWRENPFTTRREQFDQWAMRAAGAALEASLRREPALAALRSVGAIPRQVAGVPGPALTAQGVVTLRLDAGRASGDPLEQRIADCIASSMPPPRCLENTQPALAVRNALFPWLDPGVTSERTEEITALLAQSSAQDRLERLGVSHLVLFKVSSSETEGINKGGCVGAMGGAGCFGQWESSSTDTIDAAVWDVAARRLLPVAAVQMKRKIGALGLGLPIPYFSSNSREACEQLKKFVGEDIRTSH
jgi:hypothetical protein